MRPVPARVVFRELSRQARSAPASVCTTAGAEPGARGRGRPRKRARTRGKKLISYLYGSRDKIVAMRIAIVGAGGVGGYFGGRLAQAGIDTVFIARGATLDALRTRGLRVDSINGDFNLPRVNAVEDPAEAGPVDAILVAVKAWQIAEVAPRLKPMLKKETIVVPLENGMEAPDTLASILGAEHAAGGMCAIVSFVVEPGHIRHMAADPRIVFGELDNQRSFRAEALLAALKSAGISADIAENIQQSMWTKFLFIVPYSAVGAVTRMPAGVWRSLPESRAVADRALDELLAVARAGAGNATAGRVVSMVLGTSGIICKKVSATLASTGTPSFFLHPAEAIHGDLGMVVRGDVVLAISNSGETEELVRLIPSLKRLGAEIVAITGNPNSTLARGADFHLSAAISKEACPLGLAPTASTTATLALGDALAIALLLRKGFKEEDFAFLHPGGKLGKRFQRVADLMHGGEQIPAVRLDASMKDAIYEMSKKRFGITAVVDDGGVLRGAISDGDLRRLLEKDDLIVRRTAGESMTADPITIAGNEFASAALQVMEERKITSLFIADESGRLEGIIHLHDLWGLELF